MLYFNKDCIIILYDNKFGLYHCIYKDWIIMLYVNKD